MTTYEYIRIRFDFADLDEMNRLSSEGWRVVSVKPVYGQFYEYWALLERPTILTQTKV